jgi:hypothetical protein
MSDLESRLSRALKDFTERVDPGSIRPLREPPVRRRTRAVRWLAPAAAVAAVIGVVAGVSLASRSPGHRPVSVPSLSLPEPVGPMPLYYVTAYQSFVGSAPSHVVTMAAVHDSATGALLATVSLPTLTDAQGGTEGASITAAGDDRTFVITEQSDAPKVVKFYRLRLAANGRSATLSALRLSVPGYLSLDSVALSPDGTRLALGVQHCSNQTCPYTGIRVVTIATGAASTWITRVNGAPFDVSWAGDQRVAFEWQSGVRAPAPGQQTGYRLLSVTGTGRNLLAARAIASPPPEPTQYTPAALVTPDGNLVITSTVQNIPDGPGRDTVVAKIVELAARTGQLVRVLYTVTQRGVLGVASGASGAGQLDQGCNVLSLGPAGVHVLVACPGFGRVDGHRFTALPGFPSPSSSGISGQQAGAW